MDSGFTSWHDIGSLFILIVILLPIAIIIFAWVLNIIIKIKPPSATGGRGKSMKGGESYESNFVYIILSIVIIIFFIIILVAVLGGGDVIGILGGGGGGKRI